MLLLAHLLACTPDESVAERRTRALLAAAGDEPGADAQCATLRTPEVRGDCLVTWLEASQARAEAGTVCASIEHAEWRAECWFVVGEARMRAGRGEEAIAACRDATGFEADCAGHLHREATLLGPGRSEALTALVEAAFPDVRPPDAALERRMLRAAALRDQDKVTLAPCATARSEAGRAVCVAEAAAGLQGRWERRAANAPDVARALCEAAADGALPDTSTMGRRGLLLAWERTPELDAAVRAAQARVCEGEAWKAGSRSKADVRPKGAAEPPSGAPAPG